MVTQPFASVVQRLDEQLRVLQAFEERFGILVAGDGSAQLGVEFIEHRCLFEKPLQGLGQVGGDILGEVVGEVAFRSRQPGQAGLGIAVPGQCLGGELQASDPAFAASMQQADLRLLQG